MKTSPLQNFKKRVVITGLGAVSPLGLSVSETWAALQEGKSGAGPITLFDASECSVKFAAEVKGFDPTRSTPAVYPFSRSDSDRGAPIQQAIPPKDVRRMGRFTQFALSAGLEAYLDSGLDSLRFQIPADRMGTSIGVGMGGLPEIEAIHCDFKEKGFRRISPFFIPQVIANMAAGQLSILLNLQGPNLAYVTACTSSAHSLGESFRLIQRGDADVMICGGAEAVISPLGIGGFAAMKALSTLNENPAAASRPWDRKRDGFVMGEGSAVLVLEERDHALRRGAKIYGEIVGYGLSGDAYHMTTPAPEGEGGKRSMLAALASAGLEPSQIGYVNAHGTSTPAGDVEEARAIRNVFESGHETLFVSSTKSMTGHLLGAAGALEAMITLLALKDQIVPPTLNLDDLDPGCQELGLNFTPHRAVRAPLRYALSNSFGFGGTNASLIFASEAIAKSETSSPT